MTPYRTKIAQTLVVVLALSALVAPAVAKPGKGKGGSKPAATPHLSLTLSTSEPAPGTLVTATAVASSKVKGVSTPDTVSAISFTLDGETVDGSIRNPDGSVSVTFSAPADGEHVVKASYTSGKKMVQRAAGFTVLVPVVEEPPAEEPVL